MNIDKNKNKTKNKNNTKTKDIFDEDFEVIYQEDHYSALLRDELDRDNNAKSSNNSKYDEYDKYDDSDYDNDDDYNDDEYDDYDDYDDDEYDDYDDYDDDEYDDYNDYDDDEYDDYDDYDDDYDYDNYNYGRRGNNRYNRSSSRSSDERYDGRKRHKVPNLASPAAKTVKTSVKIIQKLVNLILRGAALILTAVIIYTLSVNFWKNHSAYGDVFRAFTEKNYILAAYAAVSSFLLLFELIAFLLIFFTSMKHDRRGERYDTGRGLFSFVFIYAGSYLSSILYGMVPATPAPLQGVQGALLVYGSLHTVLLPLCIAGVISCLVRKFVIR